MFERRSDALLAERGANRQYGGLMARKKMLIVIRGRLESKFDLFDQLTS